MRMVAVFVREFGGRVHRAEVCSAPDASSYTVHGNGTLLGMSTVLIEALRMARGWVDAS